MSLLKFHDESKTEIGVDEVGRGPLFGRVYSAAVILPKDDEGFHFSLMKDSKRFHSKKKIEEVADHIKTHAVAWAVAFEDETVIDSINILNATQQCMHKCVTEIVKKTGTDNVSILVDGNYFKPLVLFSEAGFNQIPSTCVVGGDNKYASIAAASILAKVARDAYIEELCAEYPELSERYCIDSNKGYGAKKHIDGIKEHGITPWHRKTFGICKTFV
jgi:ribonuclease HII